MRYKIYFFKKVQKQIDSIKNQIKEEERKTKEREYLKKSNKKEELNNVSF